LNETLAAREARIAELEAALGEARRSGKRQAAPFSKGEPSAEPKQPGRKSGKKHGKHGHRRVPTRIDRELDAVLPEACPECGGGIGHVGDAEQFQVELPTMTPLVTKFRVRIGRCQCCGKRVQGRHPEQASDALGAAASQVGGDVKAWAAWLHYELGLSFAKCAKLLARLGVDVTAGAICSAAQSTGTSLVPVQRQIIEYVNRQPAVVMDETGWRVAGMSAWLWAATCADATVYNIDGHRSYESATLLIDEDYAGVIVRDGWAPYRSYQHAAHQTCVAHLLRRCHELEADLPAWARHTPRDIAGMLHEALDARDLHDDERASVIVDLSERFELIAELAHPHDECRKLVAHIRREANALFTFLERPDVDATNWRAEQAIRPAVVNRKVWGGNRTQRGAATQSRIMSLLRTANQRGIDAIDWLTRYARAPDHTALLTP
jgi:transposase